MPTGRGEPTAGTPPLSTTPLLQHPVVAGSIILVLAAAAQIAVWLVISHPRPMQATNPSSLIIHGMLYDLARDEMTAHGLEANRANSILVIVNLLLALLSGLAWLGVGQLGLGPKWGFWVGLLWVVHPSFAFLANQAEELNALVVLVPAAWCALLVWRRSRRARTALLFGIVCAVTCLVGFQGLALMLIAVPAMVLSTRGPGSRLAGATAALIGLLVGAVLAVVLVLVPLLLTPASVGAGMGEMPGGSAASDQAWVAPAERLAANRLPGRDSLSARTALQLWSLRQRLFQYTRDAAKRLNTGLWNTLDDGTRSPIAVAARSWSGPADAGHRPSALRFLFEQCRTEPGQCLVWVAGRLWLSVYATTDGLTHYPLVILQLTWLTAALWGLWIAVRYPPWRWLAVTAGLFMMSQWLLVAVAEPLARDLTPIGGFVVLFALVGVVDVYERLFGRRLTAPAPASQPARLRRLRRNLRDRAGL